MMKRLSVALCLVLLFLVSYISSHKHGHAIVPVMLWSGKHYQYFNSQYQQVACHEQYDAVKDVFKNIFSQQQTSVVKGITEKPEVIVAFVQRKMRSDEFLRYAGAFSSAEQNAFGNLQQNLKTLSGSSLLFADCASESEQGFLNKLIPYLKQQQDAVVTVINEAEATSNAAYTVQEFIVELNKQDATIVQKNKMNIFTILFDDFHAKENPQATLKANDETMQQVVTKINELTQGNFIALWTANEAKAEGPHHGRKLLNVHGFEYSSIDIDSNPNVALFDLYEEDNNSTSNSTTEEVDIYIDETVAGATIIGVGVLVVMFFAFQLMTNLRTADHITDAFVGEEQKKKMQ